MASFEEELRIDDEENKRELEFIRNYLPQEVKTHFTDDDIYYLMDAIVDYYFDSGILESAEEEIDIDMEAVAAYVCALAVQEGHPALDAQEVRLIAEADLDFQEQYS